MPSTYISGVAIASSNTATPIQVTTSVAHGLASGDSVDIQGHDNPRALGEFVITFVSATQFTLNGTVGNAPGTAVGTVVPFTQSAAGTVLASGGDAPALDAMINAPVKSILDKLAFLFDRGVGGIVAVRTFTTTGANADVVPSKATRALVIACGGGGGGAGGAGGGNAINKSSTGGGGGGGADYSMQLVPVTPATAMTCTVGAGGANGAGGAALGDGANGSDGTASTYAITSGATLATFPGGGGGVRGKFFAVASAWIISPGGSCAGNALPFCEGTTTAILVSPYLGAFLNRRDGEGGYSCNDTVSVSGGVGSAGSISCNGYAGGAVGPSGTGQAGPWCGGGPGGGGGGGPFGVGGAGGSGGGVTAGTNLGVAGVAGTAAAANTGAGGGGGGGGGDSNGATVGGGAGGAGGSGQMIVVYLR